MTYRVVDNVHLAWATHAVRKRDLDALEKRRVQAVRLLDQGLNRSHVARQLKVVPQTVSRWAREGQALGVAGH